MKQILNGLAVCLTLFICSQKLVAQKSGKYYGFSVKGSKVSKGKVKVNYNESNGRLNLKQGRYSMELYTDRTKTYKFYKEKMFYREGSNSARVFMLDNGDLLMTNYNHSTATDDCKVTYNPKKDGTVMYLSMDKSKTSAVNKEKAIELFQKYHGKLCRAYKTYMDSRLAGVKLPPEGMKNNKLLAEATKAAKDFMKKRGWKETMVSSYIFSKEWYTIRHKSSGRILGRSLRLIGLLKLGGRCSFGHFFIRQNYNGQKYGVTFCNANSRTVQVSCQKINNR